MKSVIAQGSTIAKAIEEALKKADMPQEFFVKILEDAQSGFLGFGSKKAKIALFFKNIISSDKNLDGMFEKGSYADLFNNPVMKKQLDSQLKDLGFEVKSIDQKKNEIRTQDNRRPQDNKRVQDNRKTPDIKKDFSATSLKISKMEARPLPNKSASEKPFVKRPQQNFSNTDEAGNSENADQKDSNSRSDNNNRYRKFYRYRRNNRNENGSDDSSSDKVGTSNKDE